MMNWGSRSHLRPYDRADHVAAAVERIVIWLFVAVLAGNILRAAIDYNAWKWMVGR